MRMHTKRKMKRARHMKVSVTADSRFSSSGSHPPVAESEVFPPGLLGLLYEGFLVHTGSKTEYPYFGYTLIIKSHEVGTGTHHETPVLLVLFHFHRCYYT